MSSSEQENRIQKMLANMRFKSELKNELMSEQNHRFDVIEKQLNQLKGLTEVQKLTIKSQNQQMDCLKSKSEEQSKLIESQKADINLLMTSIIKLQQKVSSKRESDTQSEGSFHGIQKSFSELKQELESETTQRLDLEKRLKTIELKDKMDSNITEIKSNEDKTLKMKLEFIEKSLIEYQKEFKKINSENENLKQKMNYEQGRFHTNVSGLKQKIDSEFNKRLEFENLLEEKVFGLSQNYSEITKLNSNGVPIGFTYIQFFSQPSPLTLWPNVEWEDITSTYAGLFFRAEGNESLPFGEIQEQQTQSLDFYSHQFLPAIQNFKSWHRVTDIENQTTLLTGAINVVNTTLCGIKIKCNDEEIRPRNQSIRIWTRIK